MKVKIANPLLAVTNPKKNKKGGTVRRKKVSPKRRKNPIAKYTAPKRTKRVRKNPAGGGNNVGDFVMSLATTAGGFIGAKIISHYVKNLVAPDTAIMKPAIEAAIAAAIKMFGAKVISAQLANSLAIGAGAAAVHDLLVEFMPDGLKGSLADLMGENTSTCLLNDINDVLNFGSGGNLDSNKFIGDPYDNTYDDLSDINGSDLTSEVAAEHFIN